VLSILGALFAIGWTRKTWFEAPGYAWWVNGELRKAQATHPELHLAHSEAGHVLLVDSTNATVYWYRPGSDRLVHTFIVAGLTVLLVGSVGAAVPMLLIHSAAWVTSGFKKAAPDQKGE
jgi:hypothetical protein